MSQFRITPFIARVDNPPNRCAAALLLCQSERDLHRVTTTRDTLGVVQFDQGRNGVDN
jgi:hypothetical protein